MRRVLPVIVISQFLCTSLWFAGNAVIPDIMRHYNLAPGYLANITSAVQFGFITGTLAFAILTISDRFRPSLVFFSCAVIAGLFNIGISFAFVSPKEILVLRFFTGFFLAGIYPVGMKIASDHFEKGLGRSLGFLVGALVVGTALPHLLKSMMTNLPWNYVVFSTTILSITGGLGMLFLVPDGPFRTKGQQLNITAFLNGFSKLNFRSASFGYFGHMWELYTFWAFVPVMLATYNNYYKDAALNIPLLSFLIIASGGPACVISGLLSQYFSTKKIATVCLMLSFACCIFSPFFLLNGSVFCLIAFLIFWGMVVIADSPLFSTLVAQTSPKESRGTALTIVNCIGFSITILSIQFIKLLSGSINDRYIYMLLAIGPLFGILALLKNNRAR